MTIEQALEEFLLAGRADGLRPATLKWYGRVIGALVKRFAGCELTAITKHDMRQYIADMRERKAYTDAPQKPEQEESLSRDSIASYVTGLHRFWSWAAGEWKIDNPMKDIKRPKRPLPQPKAIDGADFVAMFSATKDTEAGIRDRALLAFFADTGARLGGVLSLTVDRLHIEARKAYVHEKGGKSRVVFFTYFTAQLLARWLGVRKSGDKHVFISPKTSTRLSESGLYQIWKRLKKRSKVIGRVNPHSFRHRFAREFILNGGDIATLAKMLGNSIRVASLYYAVFDEDELRDMHDKFNAIDSLEL